MQQMSWIGCFWSIYKHRMMTSEDELLDNLSYFPYNVDLGLVTKSAFSATANLQFIE